LLINHLSRLAARECYTEVEIAVREWLQQQESNFNADGILLGYYSVPAGKISGQEFDRDESE